VSNDVSAEPPQVLPATAAAAPVMQRLTPWFGVTGLLLLATLLAAAFVQVRQYALLNMTVQYQDDYLVLSLYQVEIEYLRLREQLQHDLDEPGSPALQLRYDIFVSRIGLLDNPRSERLLASRPESAEVVNALQAFTRKADLYLGPAPGGALSPQAARALQAELATLGEPVHRLMLEASHLVAHKVTERQAQARQHNQIGLALTAFLSGMVLVFALIALRQMRKLEQRQRKLELLADQLRDARIEAESASEAKSDFLADMSHELRTPLHGLMGMLSLVKDSPRHPQAANWLNTADDSASHLLRLLDDILDLSKLESGTLALAPQSVHLATLLREVQALMQPAASAKGLGLQFELDPGLPTDLQLDPTRVRQVLYNLLTNAIKFSEAGAIVLRCRRGSGQPGGTGPWPNHTLVQGVAGATLEFDVADTGIGMNEATLARLFRRFSRADDPRAISLGGTGLGLAISRNLARLMGGEIQVRSMPGAGSVFSFRCPLRPATRSGEALDAPASAASPTRDTSTTAAASGLLDTGTATTALKVLVAEDHPVNRLYMQALLERLGHSVWLVDDGLAALNAVRERAFDLVLMDVHMPVMDGVAAALAIRALPAPAGRTPIVALTADVFADTRSRCLDAGVVEVVTKPLGLPALQSLLARRFGPRSARAAAPTPCATEGELATTPGLLDLAMVASVRDLMGPGQVPALYSGFFDQAGDAGRRMRDAMRDADPEALKRAAHNVKGAALNLGLPALADAADGLNRDADALGPAPLALAVQRFEELVTVSRHLCAGEGLLAV